MDLLRDGRARLAAVEQLRARRVAELAQRSAELKEQQRTSGDRRALMVARDRYEEARAALAEVQHEDRQAKLDVSDALARALPADPADEVASLDASYPIALVPVRLETRFFRFAQDDPDVPFGELRVRIYPDSLAAHSHEPLLTSAEAAAGREYWQKAWADRNEREGWTVLLTEFNATRAAWIVRVLQPLNFARFGESGVQPVFPPLLTRPPNWTRPPRARVLPDRWLVILYRENAEVYRAVGAPVQDPLTLSLTLSADLDDDAVDLSGDGLRIDPDVLWTFDFERAEQAGMAVRFSLAARDFELGFQRVLALGVKSSLTPEESAQELEALLDGHHYTRGLSFVAQGTPTNNTRSTTSGYPVRDPGGAQSFAIERGVSLARPGADGERFMAALGLRTSVADHIEGADRDEQRPAWAMATALWPGTLGYFLDQLMAPVLDRPAIQEAWRHFNGYVRARGAFPAFRVGDVPYALLAISSLYDWQPELDATGAARVLPPLLLRARGIWARLAGNAPHVNRTNDPDADLLETLALDASTREVRVRYAIGFETQVNLIGYLGAGTEEWVTLQRTIARQVLDAIGQPDWDPRVLYLAYGDAAWPVRYGLITGTELTADRPAELLSETQPLGIDYIRYIRRATVEMLREPAVPGDANASRALLYLMVRHAALNAYARAAKEILVDRELMPMSELREPELVRITPESRDRPTIWQRFDQRVAGLTGNATLGEYLSTPRAVPAVPQDMDLATYRSALRALEGLPTAELDRLFTETLDVCSHRLDAWIGSLFTHRLQQMREARPRGSHLGGYGWVENLRPDVPAPRRDIELPDGQHVAARTDSDGYIYAPSMAHAATAAVLRNAYRTRGRAGQETYAVNLSSVRVRTALWLMDSVREGQPLGAVLGYTFERGLHDRSQSSALQLDRFIDPFRRFYPLVDQQALDNVPAGPGVALESIAARNVVNGLRLREAWRAGTIPWDNEGLRPGAAARAAIEEELRALDDAVDALSDLLLAESVHQVIRGSTEGAGASLDTMAKGVRPPDPEIARVPRGGSSVFHRAALVLGGDPLPNDGWANVPLTPRARAEPYLNAWAGQILGNAANVRCRVTVRGRATPVDVTLADLRLQPLDVLALARAVQTQPLDAELDRRVGAAALAGAADLPPDSGNAELMAAFVIEYRPANLSSGDRSFPEILEICRAIGEVIGRARPLQPADLLPPERAADARLADLLRAELDTRAGQALDYLRAAGDVIEAALAIIDAEPPDSSVGLDELDAALRPASLFGIAGAFPLPSIDAATTSRADRVARGRSVFGELRRRQTQATAAQEPVATLHAVFGRDFTVLPRFVPARPDLLAPALTTGPLLGDNPEQAISIWFAQAARVHEGLARWRRLALYAGTTGHQLAAFDIAQLHHEDGAHWVALPFDAATGPPPSGKLSLALHRAVQPVADQPWVGLLLDEWTEIIPSAAEQVGAVFQFDSPGAQAPQAVLLAVPPVRLERWDLNILVRILHQTLELARIRALDLEQLGLYGQLIPTTFLAANAENDTISTPILEFVTQEYSIVTEG